MTGRLLSSLMIFTSVVLFSAIMLFAETESGTDIRIEKTGAVEHAPAGAEAASVAEQATDTRQERSETDDPDWRIPVGTRIERFTIKDINNRLINAEQLKDWIIVYGFGNEKTADEAIDWLERITLEEQPGEGILFVCVADTSKHNSKILRPVVKKILKKEYRKNINKLKAALKEKNIELGYKLENRFMLVADMHADIYKLFGLNNQREKAHIVIVDGNHRVVGHFTEYSQMVPETLRLAVTQRETEKQLRRLAFKKRKKNMLVRYAVGGALGYLVYKAFD